jgi:hypothetical protein
VTMSEPADVRDLRSVLSSLGFVVDHHRDGGAFEVTTFARPGIFIDLTREYVNWLVTMTIHGVGSGPASFWLQALKGSSELPVAAGSDIAEFAAHLEEILVHRRRSLRKRLRRMASKYRSR